MNNYKKAGHTRCEPGYVHTHTKVRSAIITSGIGLHEHLCLQQGYTIVFQSAASEYQIVCTCVVSLHLDITTILRACVQLLCNPTDPVCGGCNMWSAAALAIYGLCCTFGKLSLVKCKSMGNCQM